MTSFDVTKLFTTVPVHEALDLTTDKIKQNIKDKKHLDNLRLLLKLTLEQNTFTFNVNIYQQNDGLPMGFPIRPILAEIFLDHLENQVLKISSYNNIKKWVR